MSKVLVVLSGGMDSTVLLHYLIKCEHQVRALGINYGQRHKCELDYARWQCESLNVPFEVADLSSLAKILPGSSQTSHNVPVPEGHYTAENMKATVVPNRNMILLAVAMGNAIAWGADYVAYAAHAGDHAIYPDCRPEFAAAMDHAATLCDFKPLGVLRPFIKMSKAQIVEMGQDLGVNFLNTYSCYQGLVGTHCGKCGTCVERAEAFALAGVPDPTTYTDPYFAEKAVQAHKHQTGCDC